MGILYTVSAETGIFDSIAPEMKEVFPPKTDTDL